MERILYPTHTLCPECAFVDRKGIEWDSARVVERDGGVYMEHVCPTHGPVSVRLSSEEALWARLAAYAPGLAEEGPGSADMEDLLSRARWEKEHPRPLQARVEVTEGGAVLGREVVLAMVAQVQALYPPDHHYILWLGAGAVADIQALSDVVQAVRQAVDSHCPVVIEVAPDRLEPLLALPGTVCLHPAVFPAVRTYLSAGAEAECVRELAGVLERASSLLSPLQLAVVVAVQPPLPDLVPMLALLRAHPALARLVLFHLERPPAHVLAALSPGRAARPAIDTDLAAFLGALDAASGGDLGPHRLFPLSVAMVAEPLLAAAGVGRFSLRPSPFCVLCGALVHAPGQGLLSAPLPALLDIPALFAALLPLLRSRRKLGLLAARSVRQALRKAVRPGAPEMVRRVGEDAGALAGALQVVVVHNTMDIATLDLRRRARCGFCTVSRGGVVAECTHCL